MAKKKGLGKTVLFKATGTSHESAPETSSEPEPAKSSRGRPKLDKDKATFYLSEDILDLLDEVWLDIRRMAPKSRRKGINKSIIVEAALEVILGGFEKDKEASLLSQMILGSDADEDE